MSSKSNAIDSNVAALVDSSEFMSDFRELNDVEFCLPMSEPLSLENVLWNFDSEQENDSTSQNSLQTTILKSMLYHCTLQGISAQISSAEQHVRSGVATAVTNSVKYVAIGTSHGYVLVFNSEQKLCWYSESLVGEGAVSALAFNTDSTRLLVGYERGCILMLDALQGHTIRKLPDAHAPQSAVLQLRFTSANNLALVGDSAGCVFSITFSRHLGIRSWDSKCIFSGSRGEVCCFEPLTQGHDLLGNNIIIAMATLSKVIVISLKPKLCVIFSQQLAKMPTTLPHLSWQLVLVGKSWEPVLAWGRGNELNYTRIILATMENGNNNHKKLRIAQIRTVKLPYVIAGIHWLGRRNVAILDANENLRLIDVRTNRELEVLELSNSIELVYSSAHFKALAIGGGVSEAFALAANCANYNSFSSRGSQLLVLGSQAVHLIKLRSWLERLLFLSEQGHWTEALNMAANEGCDTKQNDTLNLLQKYFIAFEGKKIDDDSLAAVFRCCVKLDKIDLICTELWNLICSHSDTLNTFYALVAEHVSNGALKYLSPGIVQQMISHLLASKQVQVLSGVLLRLDLSCLDLHQVLIVCKQMALYDAWIHVTTKAIGDYTAPLTEFLIGLTPDNHSLGNTMLVYVSSCLAGFGYPDGYIKPDDIQRVKSDVLRCLEAQHSANAHEDEDIYPYMRALLHFNTRECLNVVKLAFTEHEFSGEMGLVQRQRLVLILMQIVTPSQFNDTQCIILACFIAKLVATNNLEIDEATLDIIIKTLTNSTTTLKRREHLEREQMLLDLIHAKKMNAFNAETMIELALKINCFKVAEYLYIEKKDFSNIITCFLSDDLRKSEVFAYILMNIKAPERCIKAQFLANIAELLRIDAKKCVEIIYNADFIDEIASIHAKIQSTDCEIEFAFLHELINCEEKKIGPKLAERYLELLCIKNSSNLVENYVKLRYCRVDVALAITLQYGQHLATSFLLEQLGDYSQALQLLLENNLTENAIDLCIKGADHLDAIQANLLWKTLLNYPQNYAKISLKQFIRAVANHVPSNYLLEFVNDVKIGDLKHILYGITADCAHDVRVLSCTLQLLEKDLHQGIAMALSLNGRSLSISKTICNICQGPFFQNKQSDQLVSMWDCGHGFHLNCISIKDETSNCPNCRREAIFKDITRKSTKIYEDFVRVRPDLEGHY